MKSLLFAALSLGPLLPPAPSAVQPPRPRRAAGLAAPTPDSTTVRLLYGTADPELNEVVSRVLNIEKHRLLVHDKRLANRLFHITYQEFRLGRAGAEQELAGQPGRLLRLDSTGTLNCTIYARRATESTVENCFLLPNGMVRKTFAADPKHAADYSLRADIRRTYRAQDQTGSQPGNPAVAIHLPVGPKVPLLAYTLPYEADGMLQYCTLAQSRVPLQDWYQRFKIPHFVVYYVRVE